MEGADVWVSRAAVNDAFFGEINDDLRVLNEKVDGVIAIEEFVCECVETGCTDRIALTIAEYEAVRGVPTRYAVQPGHVDPDYDDVVSEHDRFTVVEKRAAAA
jgi:hypothetical protein